MNNTGNRKALGRGLDSLLPGHAAAVVERRGAAVEMVRVAEIRPNPRQPRRHFDADRLAELAQSIGTHGVLQPLLVRRRGEVYELIAGERRFRAAQQAGVNEVPVLVRPDVSDHTSLEFAIIENLQREDLNPLEQARAFERLQREFGATQDEIAAKTGKDRSSVANFLRLLKLDAEVQAWVEAGNLSMGHARALLGLAPELQCSLGRQALQQGWSVREIERQSQAMLEPQPARARKLRDPNVRDAEEQLTRSLGAKVRIQGGGKRKGTIAIAYSGLEDFQRLFDRLLR